MLAYNHFVSAGTFGRAAREDKTKMRSLVVHFLFLLLLLSESAAAYNFTLNRVEFLWWPEYCRVKYVLTTVGQSSGFAELVPRSVINKWRPIDIADLPNSTPQSEIDRVAATDISWWAHLHHGCAGMVWLKRAERLSGKDRQRFEYALNGVYAETRYFVTRVPPSEPMHWVFQTVIARATFLRGQRDDAIKLLQTAVRKAPMVEEVHTALGLLLYKQSRLPEALAALRTGLDQIKAPSAELNYLVGFVLARMERYAEAEPYAATAYRQGYPTPWLRNRLRANGYLK